MKFTDLSSRGWIASGRDFFQRHLSSRVECAIQQHQLLLEQGEHVSFKVSGRDVVSGEALQCFPFPSARIPGHELIGDSGIYKAPHFVDPHRGLHICNKPIAIWYSENRTIEHLLYALWTGLSPSPRDVEELRTLLKQAREEVFLDLPVLNVLRSLDGLFSLLKRCEFPALHTIIQHILVHLSASSIERDMLIRGHIPSLEHRFLEWIRILTIVSVLVPYSIRLFFNKAEAKGFLIPESESIGETYALGFGLSSSSAEVFDMLSLLMLWHDKANGSTLTGCLALNFATSLADALQGALAAGSGISHCEAATVAGYQMSHAAYEMGFDATLEDLVKWFEHLPTKVYAVGHPTLEVPVPTPPDYEGDPRATIFKNYLLQNHSHNKWASFALRYFQAALKHLDGRDMRYPAVNVDAYTATILRCIGVINHDSQIGIAGAFFHMSRMSGVVVEGFWDLVVSRGIGFLPKPQSLLPQSIIKGPCEEEHSTHHLGKLGSARRSPVHNPQLPAQPINCRFTRLPFVVR